MYGPTCILWANLTSFLLQSFEDDGFAMSTAALPKKTNPRASTRAQRDLAAAQDHTQRVNKTITDRGASANKTMDGVLQGAGYAERDQVVALDIVDWTEVDNLMEIRMECKARGLATHGRMLAFSKLALQNALNRFDEKERAVNHTASHMDDFVFDRERCVPHTMIGHAFRYSSVTPIAKNDWCGCRNWRIKNDRGSTVQSRAETKRAANDLKVKATGAR